MPLNKFGKNPFRSPQNPGISGFLGEASTVFYSSLFGTQGVGRVSDLICAALGQKMPGRGVDELRLRAVLLFSFFEAWRAQGVSVTLEAGFDDEKIAVGIGFNYAETAPIRSEGLAERVANHEPRDLFEALLSQIHDEADRVYLKINPAARRVELVSLLAIHGKIDSAQLDERCALEMIDLPDSRVVGTAAKSEFIELGDVNYDDLLRENGPRAKREAPTTGEILAHGCTELTELQDALRAQSKSHKPVAAPPEEVRIAGVTEIIQDDSVTVVDGEGVPEQDETEVVVSGGGGRKQVTEFIRRVWPFKKAADSEPSGDAVEESDSSESVTIVRGNLETEESTNTVVGSASDPDSAASELQVISGSTDAGGAADSFLVEIKEGSLEYTINKAQKESAEIKKEFQSSKAKRWVDGLMGELVREKARLHEIAQKLNQQIRQKELEFRNRQNTLEEELRRRDDMLRQKNNALNRTKEQLAQTQMTAERLKSATSDSAADDAQYKAKYQMTQKILSNVKDENAQMAKKLDELKAQLAASIPARGKDSAAEAAALQKSERLSRQLEEFKRVNQQLLEKLAEAQKKSTAGANVDDLRKRLELASRVSSVHQKEAEQLRLRVEELQREEMRLKAELTRATIELKRGKVA